MIVAITNAMGTVAVDTPVGARDAADLAPMLKAIPCLPKGVKR